MKYLKMIGSAIFSHYLMWFGIYNIPVTILLISAINQTPFLILAVAVQIIETYFIWWKKVFKNRGDTTYLFGNISQNNLLAIYGGIGTGKSTLANYVINHYCKDDNLKYYNYYKKGFKAFTHDYLLLKKALPKGAAVFIDEAGRMSDSSKSNYDKKNDAKRANILAFNKFFRQWYSDQSICVYVDQCESNMDTALRKTVFYVVQCNGVQRIAMPLVLGGLYSLFNMIFKWSKYNIFGLVDIEFMDFNKLGDYADHYSINYDAKDRKHFIRPAYELFKGNDTYVFEKYNPATYNEDEDYEWGTDENTDSRFMDMNFDLSSFNKELGIEDTSKNAP